MCAVMSVCMCSRMHLCDRSRCALYATFATRLTGHMGVFIIFLYSFSVVLVSLLVMYCPNEVFCSRRLSSGFHDNRSSQWDASDATAFLTNTNLLVLVPIPLKACGNRIGVCICTHIVKHQGVVRDLSLILIADKMCVASVLCMLWKICFTL